MPLSHNSLAGNYIGAESTSALATILKETKIINLKCAATPKRSLLCQRPLTRLLSHRFPSCPSLAVSKATKSEPREPLRWLPSSRRRRSPTSSALPPPKCLLSCQRPLTHLRTLPPFLARVSLASISEHISTLVPLGVFLPASCTTFRILSRCYSQSCAVWTAVTSSCRTAGSRVRPRPSQLPATSPPQLAVQQPRRRGQAGRPRRRGQRRRYHILASGRGAPRHRLACPHLARPRRRGGVCASAAHGAACVRFRCGPPRDAEGVVLRFVDHAYCHRL